MFFCRLPIFSNSTFSKNYFRNIIRVPNSLDPDQARPSVRLDLGPNCLQRLSEWMFYEIAVSALQTIESSLAH